jgi:S1-C subfamily serine protease
MNARHHRATSAAAFALIVASFHVLAAGQVPRRLQGGPMITQGPGADIQATVRELRPADQAPAALRGVVVFQVIQAGPAHQAGLLAGDIVSEFDRQSVTSAAQFQRTVRDTPPGRIVTVVFWRDGIRRETKITPVAARLE